MTHFNLTEQCPDSIGGDDITITFPPHVVAQSNHTVTISFGRMRPSTLRELWTELEGPVEWHEALAQYYFDLTGEDIAS